MSTLYNNPKFKLPESLQIQIESLRRHLARIQIGQAILAAISCLVTAAIVLFVIDRLTDTGTFVRSALFAISLISIVAVVWVTFRWYRTTRSSLEISKWLRRQDKSLGDRLMGAIELSNSDQEQNRSPELVFAALNQVAKTAEKSDLNAMVSLRFYLLIKKFAVALTIGLVLLVVIAPVGILNAILRMTMPWQEIPRYTFTSIESLPKQLLVPFGEPFTIHANMDSNSRWIPNVAEAVVSDPKNASYSNRITSPRQSLSRSNTFQFDFPGETITKEIALKIGDFRHRMQIIPTHRPEITAVEALITLPAYLQKTDNQATIDARRKSIEILQGSSVRFAAMTNQKLAESKLKHRDAPEPVPVEISGGRITAAPITVGDAVRSLEWTWTDEQGLSGKKPLSLEYVPLFDGAPQSSVSGLAAEQVVLNSEQINFSADATDDFGIKTLGIEWNLYVGEEVNRETRLHSISQVLKAGDSETTNMQAIASLRPIDAAPDAKFESGVIELRAWSQDFFPDRPRTYSSPVTLLVLTPEQHSLWITNQLDQWQRSALDVRDRELQNYEKNRELNQKLQSGKSNGRVGEDLAIQAREESANAKRLESLAANGEKLLAAAAKNESIGVGHLERWAEIQQLIQNLSKKKMPEVASLLQKASEETAKNDFALNTAESTQQADATVPSQESETKKASSPPKLSLPQTTLTGPSQKSNSSPQPEQSENSQAPPAPPSAEAIAAQERLLEEFNKLSDEMNLILGNLEASTFVKRLKAASRTQDKIATALRTGLAAKYSSSIDRNAANSAEFREMTETQLSSSIKESKVSSVELTNIVDDMDAFYQRRRTDGFRVVLDEIKGTKAIPAITKLAIDIPLEQGMSIAQAEYWSDAIDRWAEELVDPACKGNCPGSKNSDSLPPSVVLEALRLLEGQVNLREQTRVAEQRSKAIEEEERRDEGKRLALAQEALDDRANAILNRITELPEATSKFEKEIRMFEQIDGWMVDSANRLRMPDTGREEMALQTEIIESLLKSKRINPKGGGGGSGGSPGGGGQGEAVDSALALVGIGSNSKEVRETREVEQSTGISGSLLPEEYRKGLDRYFESIERKRALREEIP